MNNAKRLENMDLRHEEKRRTLETRLARFCKITRPLIAQTQLFDEVRLDSRYPSDICLLATRLASGSEHRWFEEIDCRQREWRPCEHVSDCSRSLETKNCSFVLVLSVQYGIVWVCWKHKWKIYIIISLRITRAVQNDGNIRWVSNVSRVKADGKTILSHQHRSFVLLLLGKWRMTFVIYKKRVSILTAFLNRPSSNPWRDVPVRFWLISPKVMFDCV